MASHFAMVDQATTYLKKVEQYIAAGMDTTIEVAEDLTKADKDRSNPKMNELKDIMVQYAKMDRDLHQFLEAVDYVKDQAKSGNKEDNLELVLDQKLKELEEQDKKLNMKEHEKYVELEEKIDEVLSAEAEVDDEAGPSEPHTLDESGDIAVFTQELNTKCPYTGKEMKDPVKNIHCNHNYDREGVMQLMKTRGARAKCPVAGCINDKTLEGGDLVDNKELKQQINRKGKGGRKGRR